MSLVLTAEQLSDYQETGYLFLPGVFSSDETQDYLDAAEELRDRVSPIERGKPRLQIEPDLDQGEEKLRMVEPLIDLSPGFEELSRDPRILGPLEQIFKDRPLLFEDKVNYKPARVGSGFPLHQDYSYWLKFSKNLVSIFIHFDDSPEERGCMQVVPGTHKMGLLKWGDGHLIAEKVAPSDAIKVEAEAGDMLIFHCMTAHTSEPNRSDHDRRAIVFTYNPESDGDQYRYSQGVLSTYH